MTRHRLREQNDVCYDGSCDVCGADDAAGYYRVVYEVSNLESYSGRVTVEEYECFDCHQGAKSRDRQRERETFDTHLV